MKTKIIVSSLLMFALALTASAQSTVTGTLTGGSSGSTTLSGTVGSGSGSLTGTVGSGGGTLTGTVTAPPSTGGGGGGTGGGGGGGGGSAVVTDYCPNIAGLQSSLPAGYGIQNGQCILLSAIPGSGAGVGGGGGEVLGAETGAPGVPNTGAGSSAGGILLALALSALAAAAGGIRYLHLRRA